MCSNWHGYEIGLVSRRCSSHIVCISCLIFIDLRNAIPVRNF
ncbi:hypothetical protein RchiOBHm_Chr5g0039021 [Rosa chinensis]|uniref:Uncharacterized protein n=1 Tax=Rosa chinensis TaxID=74649 RepID=A0A2P6QC62_ROSCH|nr:hypothetical protein RchiOBHm_Chr5g0039021 [Rosa chinensis]